MKYSILFAIFITGCHYKSEPKPIINQKYLSSEIEHCKLVYEKDLDNEGIILALDPNCHNLTRALAYMFVSEHHELLEAQP